MGIFSGVMKAYESFIVRVGESACRIVGMLSISECICSPMLLLRRITSVLRRASVSDSIASIFILRNARGKDNRRDNYSAN